MPVLNGIGRAIEYEVETVVDKQQIRITSLCEGEFKEGRLQGYARCMNFENECCMVGFWQPKPSITFKTMKKDDALNSILNLSKPKGKWCSFHYDGSFKNKEGEYDGYKKFREEYIADFNENFGEGYIVK